MRSISSTLSTAVALIIFLTYHSASCFQPSARLVLQRGAKASRSASASASALQAAGDVDIEENNDVHNILSRRSLFGKTISSLASAAAVSSPVVFNNPSMASARAVSKPLSSSFSSSSSSSAPNNNNNNIPTTPERDTLLQAISNNSSDEIILNAIQNLLPLNPLKSSPSSTYQEALDGEWQLLYTSGYSTSPLLKLPPPLRPNSYQYFGNIAAREVGEGRVAQGLTGGIIVGNNQLWLSSGAVPSQQNPSILEIYPPFRFQLGERVGSSSDNNNSNNNKSKRTIVEANSDADFRAVNARTKEAQEAPKNEYEQLYVENYGRGSLRVSVVARGDPVIVGEMFVHQKL